MKAGIRTKPFHKENGGYGQKCFAVEKKSILVHKWLQKHEIQIMVLSDTATMVNLCCETS